jgi:hypothetical protein
MDNRRSGHMLKEHDSDIGLTNIRGGRVMNRLFFDKNGWLFDNPTENKVHYISNENILFY